jgi:uncharacterized protein (TIGR03435 family)
MRRALVGAAAAAVFVVAAMAPLTAQLPFLTAPGPPADPNAQFEVVSIKDADPSGNAGSRMMVGRGRFEAVNVPVRMLIRQALRLPDYQIAGEPDWTMTTRYSVIAKPPDGSAPNAMAAMLANLLRDRFKLSTHTETRELPIFNLVVARDNGRLGPDLKESAAECQAMIAARRGGAAGGGADAASRGDAGGRGGPPPLGAPPPPPGRAGGLPAFDPTAPPACGSFRSGPAMVAASGQPMSQLAQLLVRVTGRPVVDKTGLTVLYDFSLKFAPEPGAAVGPFGPAPGGVQLPPADPDAPNIFTAVQEQLGLKLNSGRGPFEVTVIDRIEKPVVD